MKLSLMLLVSLLAVTACGEGPPRRDEVSPAEYFNSTQGQVTQTPVGRIVPDSARDVENGYVEYTTEDGAIYRVKATPNDQDGYRYSDPKRIIPADQTKNGERL